MQAKVVELKDHGSRSWVFLNKALVNRDRDILYLSQCKKIIFFCDIILRKDEKNSEAYYWRAYAKAECGQHIEALLDYDMALQLAFYSSRYMYDLHYSKGISLIALGRHKDANKEFDAALNHNPTSVDALNSNGFALSCLNKIEEALISYNEALNINSSGCSRILMLDNMPKPEETDKNTIYLINKGEGIEANWHKNGQLTSHQVEKVVITMIIEIFKQQKEIKAENPDFAKVTLLVGYTHSSFREVHENKEELLDAINYSSTQFIAWIRHQGTPPKNHVYYCMFPFTPIKNFIKDIINSHVFFDKNHKIPQLFLPANHLKMFIAKGWRAIHFACFFGDFYSVKKLLEMKVSLEFAEDGWTPLHALVISNSNREQLLKIVDLLIDEGVSIDAKTNDKKTALMLALETKNIELFNILIRKAANLEGISKESVAGAGINLTDFINRLFELDALSPTIWPTDNEYVILSEHVYTDILESQIVRITREENCVKKEIKEMIATGWKILKVYSNDRTGYLGISYIHPEKKHLVLAHRGTEFPVKDAFFTLKDVEADYEGIIRGRFTAQINDVLHAAEDALQQAFKNGYRFSTTGHSLGAWEAGLTAFHVYKNINYKYVHAVLFDSPGLKSTIQIIDSNRYPQNEEVFKHLDIIIYQSVPNAVNTAGEHLPFIKMFRLYPVIPSINCLLPYIGEFFPKFQQNLIRATWTHKLNYLSDTFNPDTGFPENVSLIKNWPTIDFRMGKGIADFLYYLTAGLVISPMIRRIIGIGIPVAYLPMIIMIAVASIDNFIPSLGVKNLLGIRKFLWTTVNYLLGDIEISDLVNFYKAASSYENMEPHYNIAGKYETEEFNPAITISVNFEVKEYLTIFEEFIESVKKTTEPRDIKVFYIYDNNTHLLRLTKKEIINFSNFLRMTKIAFIEYLENPDVPDTEKQGYLKKLHGIQQNFNLIKTDRHFSFVDNNEPQTVASSASRHSWFLSPHKIWNNIQQGFNYLLQLLPNYENQPASENPYVQPVSSLIPVHVSNAEKNINEQAFYCGMGVLPTMPETIWGPAEFQSALVCQNEIFTTYVMPKISTETAISENVQTTTPIPCQSDTYDPSTCRSVEYFGQSSVYCEGESTTVIYTPHLQPRFFDHVDSQLMLGTVVYHSIKSTVTWIGEKWYGAQNNTESAKSEGLPMAKTEHANQVFKKLEKEFNKIEHRLQNKVNNANFQWAFNALEEHRDSLAKIQEKSIVSISDLEELEENVYEFRNEVIDDLQSSMMNAENAVIITESTAMRLNQFGLFKLPARSNLPMIAPPPASAVSRLPSLNMTCASD